MLSTRTVPTDQRLLGNLLLSTGSGTELSRTSVTMVRGTSRSPVPGYDGTNMMWSWNTNGYDKSGAKTKHLSPDIILECLLSFKDLLLDTLVTTASAMESLKHYIMLLLETSPPNLILLIMSTRVRTMSLVRLF